MKKEQITADITALLAGAEDKPLNVSDELKAAISEFKPIGKTSKRDVTGISSAADNLTEGYQRATFILKVEMIDKIKAIAYWSRRSIKEVANEAIGNYIELYEEANGKLKEVRK